MLIVTTDNIEGKKIVEVKGMVSGGTVRAKSFGSDIISSVQNLVGGEVNSYAELLEQTRQISLAKMIENAEQSGCNAIVGVKFVSSTVAAGMAEILAYGTGVVVEEDSNV